MLHDSVYSDQFEEYAGACAAVAIQRQNILNDFMPEGEWDVDLDGRTLSNGGMTLREAGLLGSYSMVSETWLWSWANPAFGWEHPAVKPIRPIFDLGVPEFVTGRLDMSGFPDPRQAAATMVIAAGYTLGGNGTYAVGIDEGRGSAFFHVNDPQIPEAALDPATAPDLLLTATRVFPRDHRLVVRGFLTHHGVAFSETPRHITGRLPDDSVLTADFDADGRLHRCAVTPGAAGTPQQNSAV